MRINYYINHLLYGAFSLLLTSCCSELDLPVNGALEMGWAPLTISVSEQSSTKATGLSAGTSLASGSELGVFLTTEDGFSYDNKDYDNIKFKATGAGVKQIWNYDEATPVMLSSTKGNVYAYYPRQESGVSLNSITISNDGTDWMYTPTAVSNISMLNPSASLSMVHAMSIIRVKIVSSNEFSNGSITQLKLDGSGWATSAKLNLMNGTIGSYVDEGVSLVVDNLGTLSTTELNHDFWVVSTLTASVITFELRVGDDLIKVNTPTEVTLGRGNMYTYVLNVENAKAASLSCVSVTSWASESINFDTVQLFPPAAIADSWSGLADGVYAIRPDNKPANASEGNETCGVAIVMKGKAYQIAKGNATIYNYSSSIYWQKNDCTDISGLENFSTVDGTNDYGYLGESDTLQLSQNPATWLTGALSDFKGQSNTATILSAQSDGTVDYTIGKAVVEFRNNRPYNEGKADWVVPACGELAFMFLWLTELNDLLKKVSGAAISTSGYWSSSECSSSGVWIIDFLNGYVHGSSKGSNVYVRLVRAI